MSENFSKKIEQINGRLRSFGREAVQEIKMMKDGQVVGQVRYGYKPQYVFDAVNEILQPGNWRYEIVSKEIFDFQAVVEVKLFIRIADEWLCKGSQTGQMQIVKKNVGDAYKGAITDAIQKCFSLVSIGSDAYRGLLKEVFFANSGNRPLENTTESRPRPSLDPSPLAPQLPVHHEPHLCPSAVDGLPEDLPQIAGIEFQRRNDKIIATGNAYEKRGLLKSSGFRWDGSEKNWYKDAAVH
ncbi:hypothetical protein [Desulfopila aestuarii]|uniref:Rad52/22 family double-strand break repair protein n=1 Tax=Desulfopila aestuarii DSM 18488 TaxID=1121416 RepID=A0A1M7YLJ2_9BACT|nr:hypothetical protein [Desulfopila aestuarii]SHO53468.1 hypothetical protein SAMN02745220_05134 [Desulfopila aestuarii DSM 18488]